MFVPVKQGDEYKVLYNPNFEPKMASYVEIDSEMNVVAHISHDDYLDYIDDLSFDALTHSLGELLIEFLELFLNGEEKRINDQIGKIKIGLFS